MTAGDTLTRSLAGGTDTIVALATPHGRGAIAVIRLSGDAAFVIAARHIDPWPSEVRQAQLCDVHDGDQLLDQAVVTIYAAPRSFTGEDVVEISTHGGHVVPASVIAALISSGAREALPGEFTRRAVLNGKLDIVQAEAIGDLIDAQSRAMQTAALQQLDGGLSARISAVREGILLLESLIAYDVDFPEEDDGPVSTERIIRATDDLLGSLDLLLSTIPVGQIVRNGAVVAIVGEPNVGKSSLFNALLGENRAIVTEVPGTTRDAIEGLIDAGQWPIRLIDTAGLRESKDIVERLGVEVSERYVAGAHLLLACGDSEASLRKTVSVLSGMSTVPVVSVLTKCDLDSDYKSEPSPAKSANYLRASAVTGEGLKLLQCAMESSLAQTYGELTPELPVLLRASHVHAVRTARAEIGEFKDVWTSGLLPAPVAAVHLRTAASAMESLIGAVSTDDVLDRLFSSFCVGK